MVLRRFSNTSGQIYFFDKLDPSRQIKITNPNRLMGETHLYSKFDANGSKDATLEHTFSRMESNWAPVLSYVEESIISNKTPSLSNEQRHLLIDFLYTQWRRVPEFQFKTISDDTFEEELTQFIEHFELLVRPLTIEERAYFSDKKTIRRMRHNLLIDILQKERGTAILALEARGIAFITPQRQTNSFITGSFPVIKLTTKEETSLIGLHTEVILAISPRVAICSYGGRDGKTIKAPTAMVRKTNNDLFKQSRFIASHSLTLLTSITTQK